ncbi:MAG: type II secretion system F family protein [Bacilli bacterium]|nr:type II secretion system F family protein [Bacilli bacterium]
MNKPVLSRPFFFIFKMLKLIVLSPVYLVKYFSLGFFFTMWFFISNVVNIVGFVVMYPSYVVYKIVRFIVNIVGKLVLFLSYGVYRIVKLIFFPVLILVKPKSKPGVSAGMAENAPEKVVKIDAKKLKKAKALEEKQLRIEKEKEEKARLAEERKKRKKRENESYINENVTREKKTFGDKLNDSLLHMGKAPKRMIEGIKKRWNNTSFVKNAKNKKDINRQALLINFEGDDAKKSDKKLMYEYEGKNAEGKIVKGYFEAYSKVEVHSFLLSEGFEVYSIKTNKLIQLLHSNATGNTSKMKTKDLIFFLTQLSTYIKAGIPLVDSLKILTKQFKNKTYQRIFRAMIYDLTMGESFSSALEKQGNAFPRLLINMVKASEMTGELPEALDDMADYYTETERTRKQMISAMMYPSIVFVVAVAVVTFILLYVVPRFVEIYKTMDEASIPEFTRFVLAVSDFLQAYFVWIMIGLIIFILVTRYLYHNVKVIRTMIQWTIMHLPVFGNVIIYNEVTMFTKTFSSLLAHNVFITDSMEVLNKITNNEVYKMLILDTITNLAKGEKISEAFKEHWAFPLPAYEMIVTGEKTGQLAEMMAKVSSYYQDLHANAVTRIKSFLEPVLIISLTVVVGFIVLAVVIPMFNMYSSIQGIS